jgi:hypothetical protein
MESSTEATPASRSRLRRLFAGRPWWMNATLLFCAYMTFIYMPFDLFFKPVAEDQEVWFGFMLTGWAAKATEPLHWAIYGAGTWGFHRMRPWMWPWASLYVAQIVFGMIVWGVLYSSGEPGPAGLIMGGIALAALIALVVGLWRAKPMFLRGQSPFSPFSDELGKR